MLENMNRKEKYKTLNMLHMYFVHPPLNEHVAYVFCASSIEEAKVTAA